MKQLQLVQVTLEAVRQPSLRRSRCEFLHVRRAGTDEQRVVGKSDVREVLAAVRLGCRRSQERHCALH